jgi:hypothetical protein
MAALVCLVPEAAQTGSSRLSDELEVVFPSGSFRIVSQEKEQRIIMEEFGYRMEPGKPMLPEKDNLIALPPGAQVLSLEAEGIGGKLLPSSYRILPAPQIFPLAESSMQRTLADRLRSDWLKNNNRTYSKNDAYPEKLGRITGSGTLRKYSYVSVAVCPFSYQPLSGKLTHHDAVRIVVHFSLPVPGSARALEVERLKSDRIADQKAQELFINYDEVSHLYQSKQPPAATPADTYDYVIITTDSLASAVASTGFVAWKTALGHSVRTVLITDAEITAQPGVDLAEQIRNFLRAYYGPWGIQYVLFVGDYSTVPMRYCYPNPDDHTHNPSDYQNPGGSVPTDVYYADLSLSDAQSWDLDGDGYIGEYLHDSPDFLAEVYVGRIPTSDTSRIVYTLNKLVSFEQDAGGWKDQALQPGTILFYENQDYQGYPKIDGATLLDGLDPSVFPWPAVSLSAFIDDWRTGQYGIVNWSGHGAPFGVGRTVWTWDDGDGVPETDGSDVMDHPLLIDCWCNLDDDYPSIVFAISCNVGYPEPNGVGNLGIDLLTNSTLGASAGVVSSCRPAYISADVINYPGGAEILCYEFNRYGITEDEKLGEAMYDAKYFCFQNYGWEYFAEYVNQYNYNLYGDPSMKRRLIVTNVGPENIAEAGRTGMQLRSHPNPFNPSAVLQFELPHAARAKVRIFSVRGELVATLLDKRLEAGRNQVIWNGEDDYGRSVASGVYLYQVTAGTYAESKKMVLIK